MSRLKAVLHLTFTEVGNKTVIEEMGFCTLQIEHIDHRSQKSSHL